MSYASHKTIAAMTMTAVAVLGLATSAAAAPESRLDLDVRAARDPKVRQARAQLLYRLASHTATKIINESFAGRHEQVPYSTSSYHEPSFVGHLLGDHGHSVSNSGTYRRSRPIERSELRELPELHRTSLEGLMGKGTQPIVEGALRSQISCILGDAPGFSPSLLGDSVGAAALRKAAAERHRDTLRAANELADRGLTVGQLRRGVARIATEVTGLPAEQLLGRRRRGDESPALQSEEIPIDEAPEQYRSLLRAFSFGHPLPTKSFVSQMQGLDRAVRSLRRRSLRDLSGERTPLNDASLQRFLTRYFYAPEAVVALQRALQAGE